MYISILAHLALRHSHAQRAAVQTLTWARGVSGVTWIHVYYCQLCCVMPHIYWPYFEIVQSPYSSD